MPRRPRTAWRFEQPSAPLYDLCVSQSLEGAAATRRAACSATDSIRSDVQALRAVAVMAVLAYHLWPNRVTGGYVGVDVFFVVSGFLIGSHLLREVDESGTIRIARFWARRARRLLPASLLVLATTAIAVAAWVPRSLWQQFLGEVAASTLYVENWFLSWTSVDYLAAANAPSPVQHFWTLSVEEQFYILLPLVMLATIWLMRGRIVVARTRIQLVVGVLAAASFLFGLWMTWWSPAAAYFSTFTRGWEFLAGVVVGALPDVPARSRAVLTLSGLAAIATAIFVLDAATPFPGLSAALPVLGTVLVIWAGAGTVLTRVGAFAPVALIGRVSYGIYLWHWPPIILMPYLLGTPNTNSTKIAIAATSIALAWASTEYWEDPIRFSPRLLAGRRPRVVAAWSAGAMAIALSLSLVPLARQRVAFAEAAVVAADAIAAAQAAGCYGAEAMKNTDACDPLETPASFVPVPDLLAKDDDNRSECWATRGVAEFNMCPIGPRTGYTKHLLVIGDSHSNTLIGAYEQIAKDYGWRIDVAGHARCYLTTAELTAPDEAAKVACNEWRASALQAVRSADVDALVVTRSIQATSAIVDRGEDAREAGIRGMIEAWSLRPDIPIIVIRDNPLLGSAAACLEREGPARAAACSRPRSQALHTDDQEAAAAEVPNAHIVNLTNLYCTDDVCPAVIGGIVVYRPDGHHLTATFARSLAPYLGARIADVLR